MKRNRLLIMLLAFGVALGISACDSDSDPVVDGDTDTTIDGDQDADLDTELSELEGEIEAESEQGIPEALPFTLTREDVGEALTEAEITAFTKKITGFMKNVDYFGWILWTSHGMDKSYDENMPDYKLYWQDTRATKAGDTVTFSHTGGADNLMIRTSKILNQAIAGYFMSGDERFARIIEQYSKGMVALFQGMMFGGDDNVTSVMARAIFTLNHSYEEEGRKVVVDYDPVKQEEKYDWNAHTIPNVNNPYWGEIWVRNMRSKDDVPHMFRTMPLLKRVAAYAKDDYVREAAQNAYDHMVAFAKDIVDTGYYIRTKEKDGVAYIPHEEDMPGVVKDLASFVNFEEFIPNAECNSKLNAALLAYGEPLENDCEQGFGGNYEGIATAGHYFNFAIIRYFHLAAITNSLMAHENAMAQKLLEGLVVRADEMVHDDYRRGEIKEWDADGAPWLLAAAASGLPLTSEEARLIIQQYSDSVDFFEAWPNWDLWDESVPDGVVDYAPSRSTAERDYIRPEEMAYIMEYCFSPFRNPAGVKLVDCDIVGDSSRWGE